MIRSPDASAAEPLEAELRQRGLDLLHPCTRILERLATSGDEAMVVPSIRALGRIADQRAVETLLDLVTSDPHAEEAILALSQIPETSVLQRMLEVVKNSVPSITAACVAVLWKFGEERVVDELASLAGASFVPIRKSVMESLGQLGLGRGVEALYRGLKDQDEGVVIAALKALRGLKLDDREELIRQLTQLYESVDNPRIRATIVRAFSTVEDAKLLDLAKKALRDSNPRVRANAVELISAMPVNPALKGAVLRSVIQEGENNRVLGNVAMGLAEIDEKTAIQLLSKLLNSPQKWERASAVYAARFVKSERVVQWLTTLYTSEEDPDVLRNLLESLGEFRGKEITACFVKALSHSNALIRIGAARSLGRLADPAAEGPLFRATEKEQDPAVIAEFVSALGGLADPSRIATLARFLQHTDLRVQANTIDALDRIGTVEIIPYVEPFLNSSDNRVKANAAVAQWRAGSLGVVEDLERMLDHPNVKQRSSAIYAVGEIGQSLQGLHEVRRYLLLTSALREDIRRRPRLPIGTEDETQEPPPAPVRGPGGAAQVAPGEPGGPEAGPPEETAGDALQLDELDEAVQLIRDGEIDRAIAALGQAAARSPGSATVRYLLAETLRRHGDEERSLEAYQALDALGSHFVNAHLHLATLLNKRREIGRSVSRYFQALEDQIRVVRDQIELGRELLAGDRVPEASLVLKALVGQFPIDARLHLKAGQQYLKARRPGPAVQHLAWAWLLDPDDAEVLLKLAVACLESGRLVEARRLVERLLTMGSTKRDVTTRAAKVLAVLKKREGEGRGRG